MTQSATDKLIADNLWRDISEAPRDGARIFAYQESSGGHGVVAWVPCPGDGVWLIDAYGAGWMYPTHFRALPDDRCANALKVAVEANTEARRLIGFMTNEKIAEAARILDAAYEEINRIAGGE